MSSKENGPFYRTEKSSAKHYAKMIVYPCGIMDIMACTDPVFGDKGWESAEDYARPRRSLGEQKACAGDKPAARSETQALAEDVERSMRRARAKVRRLALANEFRFFVTLTLDEMMVDRYDMGAIVKKLNAWCSNAVQRQGLRYVLVPERHKDGAIHFHGFFNDALPVVDSGTIRVPGHKKPRKPRSKAQRAEWLDAGGQVVYNLPAWNLGFTTALELHGEYPAAVAYVCKYIGKGGDKPAGRWYYSGGDFQAPEVEYLEMSPAELNAAYPGKAMVIYPPGKQIAIVNGVKVHDQVQIGDD